MIGVRAALPADEAAWLRLRCALWPDSTPAEHAAELRIWQLNPDTAAFVAPRPEGGLCGLVEVGLRAYAEGCDTSPVGYIEGWYVDSDQRSQGIGRALIEAAEAWARARGCREMASDTQLDNTQSIAAHLKRGYCETERLVCFARSLISDEDGELLYDPPTPATPKRA